MPSFLAFNLWIALRFIPIIRKISFRIFSSEVAVFVFSCSIINNFIFSGIYLQFHFLVCRRKIQNNALGFIECIVIADKINPGHVKQELP